MEGTSLSMGTVTYLKLVYTHVMFRSAAPRRQEIDLLVHVKSIRSKEYLAGS